VQIRRRLEIQHLVVWFHAGALVSQGCLSFRGVIAL
jgi:hypothetical protein